MDMNGSIIAWLILIALAGTLASVLVSFTRFLIGDIAITILSKMFLGVIGAVVGGRLASVLQINVGDSFLSWLIAATVGALIVIVLLHLIRTG